MVMLLMLAFAAAADADPPARPLGLTAEQFQHLQQLESQPEHALALDMRASYKSERERSLEFTRASDDILSVVGLGYTPGLILTFLILGAPL
jgi:hypothetical protein